VHVLFISNYWPPEIAAPAHLGFELGETLVRFGHRVTVVTGFPFHNVLVAPAEYRGKWLYEEEMAGMRVLRIAVPNTHGASRVKRGLGHLGVAPMYSLRAFSVRDVDVVYTVSPPLPMALSAWVVGRRRHAAFCLGVQDLFPQSAIDLGLMRSRAVIGFFEAMERFAYRSAGAVTVHSEGNRRRPSQREEKG
jgi:colanic acid biosynthesis glycosyl transferase WcaI